MRPILLVHPAAQRRPAGLLPSLHVAQIRDHLLPRAAGRADRFHQRPVDVALAILPPLVPPQEHPRPFATNMSVGTQDRTEKCSFKRQSLHYIAPANTDRPARPTSPVITRKID